MSFAGFGEGGGKVEQKFWIGRGWIIVQTGPEREWEWPRNVDQILTLSWLAWCDTRLLGSMLVISLVQI